MNDLSKGWQIKQSLHGELCSQLGGQNNEEVFAMLLFNGVGCYSLSEA